MFTADERENAMEQIKNAYETLNLYEGMQGEEATSFAETAFSLNAYGIAAIAKAFGFASKVQEELERNAKENRECQQKIRALEEQLAENLNPQTYKKQIEQAFKKIEARWKEKGFTGTYKPNITEYGTVYLSFELQPFHDMWDMWTEEAEEEKLTQMFNVRQAVFQSNQFDIVQEGNYVYVIDSDQNKQKIQTLLTQLFPTIEIERWDARKNGAIFTLSHVACSIKSLQFLEGDNE